MNVMKFETGIQIWRKLILNFSLRSNLHVSLCQPFRKAAREVDSCNSNKSMCSFMSTIRLNQPAFETNLQPIAVKDYGPCFQRFQCPHRWSEAR